MRRLMVVVCSVALLVTVFAPATAADPPHQVTIVSPMTISNPSTGTFTATGPAVRSHLICPSGSVTDILLQGFPAPGFVVLKAFVCADGSKTFIVRLQVYQNPDGTELIRWAVQGGTGPYRDLQGSGSGSTVVLNPGQTVINTYTGFIAD